MFSPSPTNWTSIRVSIVIIYVSHFINLQKLFQLHQKRRESGALAVRRAEQCRRWLWEPIREEFLESMVGKISAQDRMAELEQEVVAGRMTASLAARQLVSESKGHRPGGVS